MNIYSIRIYFDYKPPLVYIVKADNCFQARQFLLDILKNVNYRVCEFPSLERKYQPTLFDSLDPEVLEILSYVKYRKKYML